MWVMALKVFVFGGYLSSLHHQTAVCLCEFVLCLQGVSLCCSIEIRM